MTAKQRRVLRLWLPAIMLGAILYAVPGLLGVINGPAVLGLLLILTGASAVVLEAR
ncbi:hypothetical protein [Pseudarthrobacter siccitolerans]